MQRLSIGLAVAVSLFALGAPQGGQATVRLPAPVYLGADMVHLANGGTLTPGQIAKRNFKKRRQKERAADMAFADAAVKVQEFTGVVRNTGRDLAKRKFRNGAFEVAPGQPDPMRDIRRKGGEFMVNQTKLEGVLTRQGDRNLSSAERADLARAQTELEARIATQRDAMITANKALSERLAERSDAVGTSQWESADARVGQAERAVRKLGGALEVDMLVALNDLESTGRKNGISAANPLFGRQIELKIEGDILVDQGDDGTCGPDCVKMVVAKIKRNPRLIAQLETELQLRRDPRTGRATGEPPGQLMEWLQDQGIRAELAHHDRPADGLNRLEAHFTTHGAAPPGPVIASTASGKSRTDAVRNIETATTATYLPGGASPAMSTAMSVRGRHWVILDGVVDYDVVQPNNTVQRERHYFVRDPDHGKKRLVSAAEFREIFDGDAIYVDPRR